MMPGSKRKPAPTPTANMGKEKYGNAGPFAPAPIKQEGKIGGEALGGPMCQENEVGTGSDMTVKNTST